MNQLYAKLRLFDLTKVSLIPSTKKVSPLPPLYAMHVLSLTLYIMIMHELDIRLESWKL